MPLFFELSRNVGSTLKDEVTFCLYLSLSMIPLQAFYVFEIVAQLPYYRW